MPNSLKEMIQDSANEVYLSVVSLWEFIVKYRLGKLPLPLSPEKYLPLQRERHDISSLSLDEAAIIHLSALPSLHRDPFDRILICPGYRTQNDHCDYGRGHSPVSDKNYPKIIEYCFISDWERGVKKPGGPALRLLTVIEEKGLKAIA